VDGACSTHGRDEIWMQHFSWKTWTKETTTETYSFWEVNIKVSLEEIGCENSSGSR
jgi:hypothetical protein